MHVSKRRSQPVRLLPPAQGWARYSPDYQPPTIKTPNHHYVEQDYAFLSTTEHVRV